MSNGDDGDGSGGSGGSDGSGGSGGLNDAGGCAVDWDWLAKERIAFVTNGLDTLTMTFESGLVFQVRAALWQGRPFLAFNPFRHPGSPPESPPFPPPR